MEQIILLGDYTDCVCQIIQAQVADIMSVNPDGAFRGIVQAGNQVGEGGLAGAAWSDQCDQVARMCFEGDLFECQFPRLAGKGFTQALTGLLFF